VFEDLGGLDRRDDRDPSGSDSETRPRLGGVGMAPDPSEQVCAVDGDPFGRPRLIDRADSC
jgi:hypothetical protein